MRQYIGEKLIQRSSVRTTGQAQDIFYFMLGQSLYGCTAEAETFMELEQINARFCLIHDEARRL